MSRSESAASGKKPRRKPTKTFYAVLAVALGLIVILVLLAVIFPRQDETAKRLEAERAAKEQELRELQLKKESLQELAALIGNRDFLIRYLREHQGYMYDGDIRIDLSDPNAEIPTPGPDIPATPLPTIAPTADPNAPEETSEITEAPAVTAEP